MVDSSDQNIIDFHRAQFASIRKENAALQEGQSLTLKKLNDVLRMMLDWREESREANRGIRADINALRSDVLALEQQNMTRHGDVMNLARRLDDLEYPSS